MMKIIRSFASATVTLILIALISGMYLFLSFRHDYPLPIMFKLIKGNPLYALPVILFSLNLFLKGVYRFSTHRLRAIPSAMIFIFLSFLISGIYLSQMMRETERYRVGISDRAGNGQVIMDIKMKIPDEVVVVGEDHDFKINNVKAIIEDRGKRLELKLFPFSRTSTGYAYINDAGISPTIKFLSDSGRVFLSRLNLLPLGREERLPLKRDYSINISLAEEKKVDGSYVGPKRYRLDSPSYKVKILKKGDLVLEGILKDNQTLKGNGVVLSAGSTQRWIEVVYVRDGVVLFLYLSMALFLLGFFLYPLELYKRFKL